MIVVNVYYDIPNGKREEFMRAVRDAGILKKVYEEGGCRKYDFYPSWEKESELLLVEQYVDQQAMDLHVATEHFAKMQEIEEQYIGGITVQRFEVTD